MDYKDFDNEFDENAYENTIFNDELQEQDKISDAGKTVYSLTEDELNALKEKVEDLRVYCNLHNIPFFFAAVTEDGKLDTKYIYEAITPYDAGRKLKKDLIAQLLLIKSGFKAVPKQKFYDM